MHYTISMGVLECVSDYLQLTGYLQGRGMLAHVQASGQIPPIQHLHTDVVDIVHLISAEPKGRMTIVKDLADVRMRQERGGMRLPLKLFKVARVT